jgi:hypothetical protein
MVKKGTNAFHIPLNHGTILYENGVTSLREAAIDGYLMPWYFDTK